ncbi:MAG: dihydroneopterin aldolase, partial [Fimbriimonas sp.]
LTLEVDEDASATDQIDGTVDYAAVAAFVADEIRTTQFRTIERLAKVVGEGILARFARVKEVTVQIAKPLPPAPILVESVSVRLVVKRT